MNEPATVTVASTPAIVTGSNQFSGTAQVPTGTSQVTVQATDASGNVRTHVYEVTQAGVSKTFTYDANRNLTGDGTLNYEWDAENRLIAVKQGGSPLATFNYDGNGRRTSKTTAGATTSYLYDGTEYLEERSTSGTTKRYVYGPGIDRPIAQIVGGVTSYFIADELGSVVRTTDVSGAPTLTREYDPWGNATQGSATSGYAFTGREWDAETGLYFYRARYYDPKIGRFLSEDPIGLSGGSPNFFMYVGNRPTLLADPLGLKANCTDVCATAKKMGLDGGDAGGVICCGGVKFACSWEQFPPSVPARAQQVIAACNRVHEQTHYDDVKCACDDCISRPPFSKGKNQKREECAGYRASLACDIARQSQCGGDPACLAALQEDMKTLQRQIRKFCGR